MGYSISAGVNARPNASGWLVLPGDMPLVQPATLQAVARALAQHAVAYAQYKGRRGHPVGFSAELYSELATLSGDEGARRLIARYPAYGVEVDDAGVLLDVDTLDDLASVRKVAGAVALPAR
jgi:molybdenum cofactor cytidylyltransferase